MSATETTEQTAVLCPGCGGPLEAAQTLCAACRSTLEEQVLAVRAADYPQLFHNVVRNSGESPRGAVDPTSMDMLKAAENTSDDLDLVPLVPMDEPRKSGAGGFATEPAPVAAASATASTSAPAHASSSLPLSGDSPTSSSASVAVPLATAPAPVSRPGQTVYTPPVAPKLEPSSRWKHVLIAVVCLVAAAVLAAVLWSVLVPSRTGDPGNDDSAAAPPTAAVKSAAK